MRTSELQLLIRKYNSGEATAKEKALLEAWYASFELDATKFTDRLLLARYSDHMWQHIAHQHHHPKVMPDKKNWIKIWLGVIFLASMCILIYVQRNNIISLFVPIQHQRITSIKHHE